MDGHCLERIAMGRIHLVPLTLLLMILRDCVGAEVMSSVPASDFEDKNVRKTVESLQQLQIKQEAYERRLRNDVNNKVKKTFPWLIQNNSIPNPFLRTTQQLQQNGLSQANHHHHHSVIVFVHHHRSAGSEVKQCMDEISRNHALASSPDMTSQERLKWDSGESFSNEIKSKLKIHKGKFTFGMCDSVTVPCSYFTMFRDPMSRAISSYEYCKQALGDELCSVVNANEVSLRDWILHHGSLFFRQLLFRSETCENDYNITEYNLPEKDNIMDASQLPCWYKHKISMETINPVELGQLLDYVVENLDKWFSVIGLVEDFSDSVKMFEHVYRFPFTKCKNLRHFRDEFSLNNIDNNSNRNRRLSNFDDNDPGYLIYDPEVKKALDADNKIYKKAKAIYDIQKQVLFNKIKR